MKAILIMVLLSITPSISGWSQCYTDMMKALKDQMETQSDFEITVQQNIYYNGQEKMEERALSKTIGHRGRLYAETSAYKILQNEKVYLMIDESEEVIFVNRLTEALDQKAALADNFQQWEASLDQYVDHADSIVLLPDTDSYLFVIYPSQSKGAKARVKLDKQSGLLTWMDINYAAATGENIRLEMSYTYNFSPILTPNFFDENRFVSLVGDSPKGKLAYRDYRVILNESKL